ncbi:MAG: pilus assembly protein [Promicromonosporaceae bacterium]|nr:pilus assembly protein [Promicromonosporaceae bacterium]
MSGYTSRSAQGSAVAEFALVSALVAFVFSGFAQVVFTVHVRGVLQSAATEGARVAARADRWEADGAARARYLITSALPAAYAEDIAVETSTRDGLTVISVVVRAPLPLLGPLGPTGALRIVGHALQEPA